MANLAGLAALVTGGAQGIGNGIVRELVVAGARVVVADRDLRGAQAAAQELRTADSDVIALRVDVTDEASVSECVAAALKSFGRIDILVNNAGIHCEKIGETSTVDQFTRCLDVNLLGVWRMTQALLPHFRQHGGGKIVNIASINGRKPWVDTPGYSASKAAVINLT